MKDEIETEGLSTTADILSHNKTVTTLKFDTTIPIYVTNISFSKPNHITLYKSTIFNNKGNRCNTYLIMVSLTIFDDYGKILLHNNTLIKRIQIVL